MRQWVHLTLLIRAPRTIKRIIYPVPKRPVTVMGWTDEVSDQAITRAIERSLLG
jgi:hypothetical protein